MPFYDLKETSNVKKYNKTFYEATGMNLSENSFIRIFNILEDVSVKNSVRPDEFSSELFYNIWKTITFNEDVFKDVVATIQHTKTMDEWWDTLANKYYGEPALDWVIMLANNVVNPFEEMSDEGTLRIMNVGYLYNLLKNVMEIQRL